MTTTEESLANNNHSCKLWLTSLEVKVRFACRLFFQCHSRAHSRKSKELKIDPKQTRYLFNQYLMAIDARSHSHQLSKQPQKIVVKLVSNRGLQFTAGNIVIEDLPLGNQTKTYVVSKSADIDVSCSIRFSFCRGEGTIIAELDDIQEEAQETSKLSAQSPEAKQEPLGIGVLPEHSKISQKLHLPLQKRNYPRKYSETNKNKTISKEDRVSLLGSDNSDTTSHKVGQIQSSGYYHLFQKQREMIDMLQKKHREAMHQQERLKISMSKYQIELQRKRQKINELEEERIKFMKQQVEKDKNIGIFGEKVKKTLEQTQKSILQTLVQIEGRKENHGKVIRLSNSVIQKGDDSDSETPLKLLEKSPKETESQECSEEQKGSDLNLSMFREIKEELKSPERRSEVFLMPSQSALSNYLSDITWYCSRISGHIQKFSQSVGRRLQMLSRNNLSFRNRLMQSRQEYESSEQSLVCYLQQLQTTLQRQLQIVNEKEQVIMNCFSMIEDLNHKIADSENRIEELQQINGKLGQEKDFIKTELHQNNYLFSIKQDEYRQKIQILQSHLNSMQVERIKSCSDVLGPFDEASQENKDSNSILGEYCQRIRNKEMELLYEKREKQRLIEQLSDREDELRSALLEKRKLQFAMRSKGKISGSEKEIDRSFEVSQEEIKKKVYLQEQFLSILT